MKCGNIDGHLRQQHFHFLIAWLRSLFFKNYLIYSHVSNVDPYWHYICFMSWNINLLKLYTFHRHRSFVVTLIKQHTFPDIHSRHLIQYKWNVQSHLYRYKNVKMITWRCCVKLYFTLLNFFLFLSCSFWRWRNEKVS